MLSVCIPVFNFDVTNLVTELHIQLELARITYEIVVMDDCSEKQYQKLNVKVNQLNNIRIIQLNKNVGRASIRNLLFKEATYNTILFLDCDMKLISEKYISNYIPYIHSDQVSIGGICYQNSKPRKSYYLHWYYGVIREVKSASIRNKKPSHSLMTGNFMVSKNILQSIPFWEGLKGYGHEDTLLGIQFFKLRIPIIHIDNPALHAGLQDTDTFLKKTEEALDNLIILYKSNVPSDLLIQHVALLKAYITILKLKLCRPLTVFFKITRFLLLKNLRSGNPSLRILDFYKLGLFCSKIGEKRK
jgi:glycosyltransferase involved in cell wall biosynthesis